MFLCLCFVNFVSVEGALMTAQKSFISTIFVLSKLVTVWSSRFFLEIEFVVPLINRFVLVSFVQAISG